MKNYWKVVAWVVANLASVPAVFFGALAYWTQIVQAEYATGLRVSTDGDNVVIPAAGLTELWIILLTVVNAVILGLALLRRYRQRPNNSFKPKPLRGSA